MLLNFLNFELIKEFQEQGFIKLYNKNYDELYNQEVIVVDKDDIYIGRVVITIELAGEIEEFKIVDSIGNNIIEFKVSNCRVYIINDDFWITLWKMMFPNSIN